MGASLGPGPQREAAPRVQSGRPASRSVNKQTCGAPSCRAVQGVTAAADRHAWLGCLQVAGASRLPFPAGPVQDPAGVSAEGARVCVTYFVPQILNRDHVTLASEHYGFFR